MASPDFEAIWVALLARIEERATGFKTITRHPKAQYGIEQYPVLELVEVDEDPDQEGATPALYTASAALGIVCRFEESDPSPFSPMNALIKSVRDALERQPTDHADDDGPLGHYTNLGGLVETLSIGRVEKSWGVASGEVWAKVPIEITTY